MNSKNEAMHEEPAQLRSPHLRQEGKRFDYDDSTGRGVVYEVSREENVMQRQVRAFMVKMGQVRGDKPGMRDVILRQKLVASEAKEFDDACDADDIVEAVDALCDLLYVIFGTAEAWGVDLATMFDEVHRTNMLKDPANKDNHGKILKPEGWRPPRIQAMIRMSEALHEAGDAVNDMHHVEGGE